MADRGFTNRFSGPSGVGTLTRAFLRVLKPIPIFCIYDNAGATSSETELTISSVREEKNSRPSRTDVRVC